MLNIPDLTSDPHSSAGRSGELYLARGVRSVVFVPMVREGQVIGAIGVSHHDVGAFSDSRVRLLGTFAEQAVIAIENVRLFKELEARTGELTPVGGAAHGAGRDQPGGELDPRHRDRAAARSSRGPAQLADADGLRDLRVRRRDRGVPHAGHA